MGKIYPADIELLPAHGREGEHGDRGVRISWLCLNCKRFRVDRPITCDAYPEGIPDTIRLGDTDHREPFEGDQGLTWDPIDGSEPAQQGEETGPAGPS